MRTIGVVTVARSDYGIYRPILSKIEMNPDLRLHLIVSGMHLSPEFGLTVREIEADGFPIGDRVEMLLSSDTPEGVSKSMGLGILGYAQSYSRLRPNILLVLGDRFEMLSAVVASIPFTIPVAHIHGGELTAGAIDEAIRHSITKMSHLHFTSTDIYARRVVQMGEEPWRVLVAGAPGLENLNSLQPLGRKELRNRYGFHLSGHTLLVTYHPETLKYDRTESDVRELLSALEQLKCEIVFTYPNADPCGRLIIQMIEQFVARTVTARVAPSLGSHAYFSLMKCVSAMVGNSSSGILEAASFKLPVVNIGDRQCGRVRGKNVIDVGHSRAEIVQGIRTAISPEFRAGLEDLRNPYYDERCAEKIVDKLNSVPIDDHLLLKRFYDHTNMNI